ncbi:MAG: hypothetical protein M3Z31_09030 [Pseudomonadota bacterium]|nr:hypothetical protein [Pseudomonadota bacterium]
MPRTQTVDAPFKVFLKVSPIGGNRAHRQVSITDFAAAADVREPTGRLSGFNEEET